MSGHDSGGGGTHCWSFSKFVVTVALLSGAGLCLFLGAQPFFTGDASRKSIANIGFMLLIVLFILGVFKVTKNRRFVFWACGFALVLYANAMFLFYDNLFSESNLFEPED
ncbi:hypothetical protein PAPHI01_0096 [Pancytospora philotis]|nr:hypothetical protein PAPHI01_0096 [Pancytospora philotis]